MLPSLTPSGATTSPRRRANPPPSGIVKPKRRMTLMPWMLTSARTGQLQQNSPLLNEKNASRRGDVLLVGKRGIMRLTALRRSSGGDRVQTGEGLGQSGKILMKKLHLPSAPGHNALTTTLSHPPGPQNLPQMKTSLLMVTSNQPTTGSATSSPLSLQTNALKLPPASNGIFRQSGLICMAPDQGYLP